MDITVYKYIHYIGLFTLFFAFGGLTLGARTAGGKNFSHRLQYTLLHGVGLLLLIVSGFGQLAKLNRAIVESGGVAPSMPMWLVTKLVIWLSFGIMISLIFRLPKFSSYIWALILILGAVASYLALFKPF
ncbi:MAG: hypothetical protein ABL927_10300 [Bdellovibrionales bacterium]